MHMDRDFLQAASAKPVRSEWQFEYTCSKLAEAAKAQREYRKERVMFWTGTKSEVIAKIRTSGIQINESLVEKMAYAASTSNSNSTRGMGGRANISVEIDEQLQEDLQEAMGKIELHERLAKEYDGWVQMLEAQPPSRNVALSHADWLYFFGK